MLYTYYFLEKIQNCILSLYFSFIADPASQTVEPNNLVNSKNPPPSNLNLIEHPKATRTNSAGSSSIFCKCTNSIASATLVKLCDSIAVNSAASTTSITAAGTMCSDCGKKVRSSSGRDGFHQLVSDQSDDVELCDHIQFLITEVASSTKTSAATAATTSSSDDQLPPVDDTGDVVTDGEYAMFARIRTYLFFNCV